MLEFRDLAQNDDKGITDGDVRDDEVDAGAVPADDGDDAEDGPEPAPTDYTKLIDEIVFVARVKDLYTPSDAHLSGPRVYGPLPIRVKLVEWDSAGRFSRVTSALEVGCGGRGAWCASLGTNAACRRCLGSSLT